VTFKHPQIYLKLFCIFEKLCGKLKIGNLHKPPFSDTKVKKQLKLCSYNLRFQVKYQFSSTLCALCKSLPNLSHLFIQTFRFVMKVFGICKTGIC